MGFAIKGGGDYNKAITQQEKKFNSLYKAIVGLPEGSPNYPDGESVIEVGAKNEFGSVSENIPPRSFIRSTISENAKKYNKIMTKIQKSIQDGGDPEKLMGKLGALVSNDIKIKIVDLKTPKNAQMTIDKKGSNNPLVDTGHLMKSITHEVIEND